MNGDRLSVPNYAIVMTDGRSNVNVSQTAVQAAYLQRSGTIVVVIGIGNDVNNDNQTLFELQMIATNGAANMISTASYSTLVAILDTVLSYICIPSTAPPGMYT